MNEAIEFLKTFLIENNYVTYETAVEAINIALRNSVDNSQLHYEIEQLKEVIECQPKDFENKKEENK